MKWFPNGFGTRATLAFALVGTFCYVAVSIGALEALTEAAFFALGFYFGNRDTANANTKAVNGGTTNG